MSVTRLGPLETHAGGAITGRLGIDQPAGWWPTTPRCKAYEAAGFTYLQVRAPPRSVLAREDQVREHAAGLRENLQFTRLELILHAPDDLLAGTPEHDLQFEGALMYAAVAGARTMVYHGARVPIGDPGVHRRLHAEELSLRHLTARAAELGVTIAIENLGPVYGGTEFVSYDPSAVHALARRLASEHAGVCLDIGHAHIVSSLVGCELIELIEPVLDRVVLFHVHDNFGGAGGRRRVGSIEPARLDLHLAPGAGTVPWSALRTLLTDHPAPLQLEVHPSQRPAPATLAILAREVFWRA